MKKQLFIFSILIVIISIFVSCSTNSSSEVISTTAVTNSNGTTHYYEPVTDDNGNVSTIDGNQSIFVEIETQSNGKAVTKKDGTYVTNEHTTVLPFDDETAKSISSTEKSSNTTNEGADNNIAFDPDKPTEETKPSTSTTTEKPKTTTTQKTTQPATDKDGWITKWY